MYWEDIQKMLSASPTYQEMPDDFRRTIEKKLPGCDAEQLHQLQLILETDRQSISEYLQTSKTFQKDLGRKILKLEELLDRQKEMGGIETKI